MTIWLPPSAQPRRPAGNTSVAEQTMTRYRADAQRDTAATVTCPAGSRIGMDAAWRGVECGVTETPISLRTDPGAVLSFCEGDYTRCPVWLAEKARVERGTVASMVDESDAEQRDTGRELEALDRARAEGRRMLAQEIMRRERSAGRA